MSYHMPPEDLKLWLSHAQRAVITKNKVRKDLWTDFSDDVIFDGHDHSYLVKIPRSHYLTIQSFCLEEGRGDLLSNDSKLSFFNTCHELRQLLNEQEKQRSSSVSTHIETPSKLDFDEKQTSPSKV